MQTFYLKFRISLLIVISFTLIFNYNSKNLKGDINNCKSIDGKELFLAQICNKNI